MNTIPDFDVRSQSERRAFLEKTILSCILCEADCHGVSMVGEVGLDPADFSDPKCASLFEAMKSIDAAGAIPTTNTTFAQTIRMGVRLAAVIQDVEANYWTSGQNLAYHVQSLRYEIRRAKMNEITLEASSRLKAGEENAKVMADVAAKTWAIEDRYGDVKSATTLADFGEVLLQRAGSRLPNPRSIQTYVPFLDAWILAMLPGEYACIAAYPSVGKSALALQIALSRAANGKMTGLFSLEMDGEAVAARGITAVTGADTRPLLRQPDRLTDNAQRAILLGAPAWRDLGRLVLFDGRRGTRVDQIANKMRIFKKMGAEMMILDYFQLVPGEGKENRNQQLTEISRALKVVAGELEIAIIVLSQFSKAAAKEKREATMHDLRDTAALEQDVDMLWILHLEKRDETNGIDHIKLVQAKGRSVGVGSKRIIFKRSMQTFGEVENDAC